MSQKPHNKVMHRDEDVRLLDFSFSPNGGADPATTSFRGAGITSIVWVSTGKWTVTLDDTYPVLVRPPSFSIERATPAAKAVDFHVVANTIDTDGKFSFVYREDHLVADIAANTNTRIGISLALRNRTVPT